ncbi:scarecrow-like protein 6 [Apium graveolens]|uniref:scarecrow-like protein 6 n=1 Tax=Apium graveolens TaxID=4045 RepID=UPI003D7B19D8
MKDMHLPFDFQGKRGFDSLVFKDLSPSCLSDPYFYKNQFTQTTLVEPTSVLDNISSPNPPTSTSTLSSSLGSGRAGGGGGGCSTDTAAVAAVSGKPSSNWAQNEANSSINVVGQQIQEVSGGGDRHRSIEKCGLGMEDWESVLSESAAASPSQEQSVLGWIMGDVEDPSLGLNKVLQIGGGDYDFNVGFGGMNQGFGLENSNTIGSSSAHLMPTSYPQKVTTDFTNAQNPMFSLLENNVGSTVNQPQQIYNPQMLINQNQALQNQNPSFFLPVSYNDTQQDEQLFVPPHPKRHNSGNLESTSPVPKGPFLDSGQEVFSGRQQQHQQNSFPGVQNISQQRSSVVARPKFVRDDIGQQQLQQQAIIDQLFKASELLLSGNVILLQGILARLNHQLSPIGKPFLRSAYYCKEALQLLLQTNNNMNPLSTSNSSPFNLIFKIGAYKSFSEISPVLQFANFTCNQALLEATDGFDRIHIIDFDIGYGGQWASFMQELALKNDGVPLLKITAFASPSTPHDQLELGLTRENLNHFANEINMGFEFEIVSLDALASTLWSLPLHVSESDAVAVNLPAGSFFNQQVSLPMVLRFIKQLSPKIVVSADRGCDRTDLPFPNHVIHVVQSYTNLLESLDAVNLNHDALNKIERFLLQPGIEKIVMNRYRSPEKSQHWRTLFLSSGFSPLGFSNFTESQAECVVKRTPVQGYHVEKRQSSLVLCWQRRELISVSAWRC